MKWYFVFAFLVFTVYFWLKYRSRQLDLARPTAAHRSGMRHIGANLVLQTPIQNGSGRIHLGNREWVVRGPNLPAGSRVRVTGVQDTTLLVDRCVS